MDGLVGVFTSLPSSKSKQDDDFVDRLNSKYTVLILVVFAITVSMHQYVGTPITCWAPVHFTGSHTSYANSYCWVRNTYYIPLEEKLPRPGTPRNHIPYYQWIPFILLGQAILFYAPSILWHSLNNSGGVDADNILNAASTFNKSEDQNRREDTLTMISSQMHRYLSTRKGMGRGSIKDKIAQRNCCGRRFGAYLVVLYILTKILYLVNVIAQLFILDKLLNTEYSVYGFHVMRWMVQDHDWTNSPFVAFPRVTMCDFVIRRLGNLHNYTIQCTLPINLYNEKIFMFLWFWMVVVAFFTLCSLVMWTLRAVSVHDRVNYIKNHLKFLERLESKEDEKKAEEFTKKYLRADGIFLLRLIGHNTNTITVTDVIRAMWDSWPGRKQIDDDNNSPAEPSAPSAKEPENTYPLLPNPEKPPLPSD